VSRYENHSPSIPAKIRWHRRRARRLRNILIEPEHIPPIGIRSPANDRLRFGMIGIWHAGLRPARQCRHSCRVECVAAAISTTAATPSPKKLPAQSKTLASIRSFSTTKKSIASSPRYRSLHKQVVVDAVNAGKDIYCEKRCAHRRRRIAMSRLQKDRGSCRSFASVSSVLCAKSKETVAQGIMAT